MTWMHLCAQIYKHTYTLNYSFTHSPTHTYTHQLATNKFCIWKDICLGKPKGDLVCTLHLKSNQESNEGHSGASSAPVAKSNLSLSSEGPRTLTTPRKSVATICMVKETTGQGLPIAPNPRRQTATFTTLTVRVMRNNTGILQLPTTWPHSYGSPFVDETE